MFEDSKTELYVLSVTNSNAAITALANNSGGFYKTADATIEEGALEAGVEYEFIHRNSKGVLNKTKPFTVEQVTNPVYQAYVARTEQVTYFGYNGTSGSLDAANNTYYSLRMTLNHTFGMLNNSPLMLTFPYKSDSSATQREVAAGLAIAATQVKDRQAFKCFKVERVNSGAQLVSLNNLSFTNGSKDFTSADDDTASILVGSIIRIEEPENNGAAVTDPCYVVASHDSGATTARIYTLDQPFQGVTNADNDYCETVTEGNWGLKFTGISVADAAFDPINDEPFVSSFDIQSSESFETAAVTYTTKPLIGRGTYQLVAAQEAYAQFLRKRPAISAYPRTQYLQSAVEGDTYAIFSFEVTDEKFVDVTTGINPKSKYRINIAVKTGLAEVSEFTTVLAAITGSTN